METKINPYRAPNAVVKDPDLGDAQKLTLPQIWFSFSGRIPRKVYWLYFFLPVMVIAFLLGFLVAAMGDGGDSKGASLAEVVFQLALVWPALAVSAKRWHDRNKSAWWILIGLIPIVGNIWALVENGILRGTVGPNRFGGDPTELY